MAFLCLSGTAPFGVRVAFVAFRRNVVHSLPSVSASSLLLLATLAVAGRAQKAKETPIADPSQDQGAVAILRQTVLALGGEAAASALKDSTTTADCTKTSKGKTETHKLRWLTSGDYFRVDQGEGDEKGVINGPHGRTIVVNGKEVPVEEKSARAFKPLHLPAVSILQSLKKDRMKIELLDDETIQGRAAFQIAITDVTATLNSFEPVTEDWWIDKSSYLPIRVSYPVQGLNSLRRFTDATLDYSNYTRDSGSGITYPRTFQRSYGESSSTTCNVGTFVANQGLKDEMFVRHAGGAQ